MKAKHSILCLLILTMASFARAQDTKEDLSQQAANPLADLLSFPFQNNLNMNQGEFNRNTNVLNIQPVFPFAEGPDHHPDDLPYRSDPRLRKRGGKTDLGTERYRLYRLLCSRRSALHLGCRSGAGITNGR
jgi:hypothetical protein